VRASAAATAPAPPPNTPTKPAMNTTTAGIGLAFIA
jgi:hypothetical protein